MWGRPGGACRAQGVSFPGPFVPQDSVLALFTVLVMLSLRCGRQAFLQLQSETTQCLHGL